ncbi:hypothetical protein ABTZ78_17010 [Streptomyces bauhiniae]|uniref:hypothetical protein n=1 Tax=Streptomyces bauhiniae TaxID=2340725 RepID=UPI0033192828
MTWLPLTVTVIGLASAVQALRRQHRRAVGLAQREELRAAAARRHPAGRSRPAPPVLFIPHMRTPEK